MGLKRTTEQFITEAKEIYKKNGKGPFDFSKTEYKGCMEKTIIICPKHGEFLATPNKVLTRGDGCPYCRKEKIKLGLKEKVTTEEFIKKAKKVHGDKYNYSKSEYKNNRTKVCIICPKHGEFWKTPNKHIDCGQGCPLCSPVAPFTTEEFIEKAKKVHGNRYDYLKTKYINYKEKVCITCHKHGDFWQVAGSHMKGEGCPYCCNSKGEESVRVFLENHSIEFETQKKFKDCKDKSYLPFDFYLPKENILIEYDGSQHFIPSKKFGQKAFEIIQKHDKIKNEYCKNNNIKLIRIKYNQDINTVLKESLS